jgi:hypothetical protein
MALRVAAIGIQLANRTGLLTSLLIFPLFTEVPRPKMRKYLGENCAHLCENAEKIAPVSLVDAFH